MIGRTLSHYRVTAALGAGGVGEVCRATDTALGRDNAGHYPLLLVGDRGHGVEMTASTPAAPSWAFLVVAEFA